MAPAPTAEQPAADSGTGAIGVSPGGVTTKIDVPAQSTEEQYAQACLAAKDWMGSKGGDPHTLVEPYLRVMERRGYDPYRTIVTLSPLRRQWTLWRASRGR